MSTRSAMARVLTVLIATAIILLPAFINGYPFVYSDTGTYLRSAFESYVPIDRPYWYGPFIRLSSFDGTSLWGVAIAQSLLCATMIVRACSWTLSNERAHRIAILASAVLTLGTGLGWYAGLLIPDVFTGIGLLAIYGLLRLEESIAWRVFDGLLILAACWFHTSNLLILPIAGLSWLLLRWRKGRTPFWKRLSRWMVITATAWAGLALANRVADGEAYISRSSHMFLIGRMVDLGMLGPYLEEHCASEHFALCTYKDSLPTYSQEFLWNERSPVHKQGGWAANKVEYDRIVQGSFMEPRYLWWHVKGSLASTWALLGQWEICHEMRSDWYRKPGSPPHASIARLVPHEESRFVAALQNGGRGELSMRWPDLFYRITLVLSLIIVAGSVFRKSGSSSEGRVFIHYAFVAVIIAAWVGATFSLVESRFLGRDSWLLPLACILFLASRKITRAASQDEAIE